MSLRELPSPQLEDLRKICMHYEKKAGGQYASDSRAARYVSWNGDSMLISGRFLFDMSREIQAVLNYIETEDDRKTKRIAYLELVVSEWEAVFGGSHPVRFPCFVSGCRVLTERRTCTRKWAKRSLRRFLSETFALRVHRFRFCSRSWKRQQALLVSRSSALH